jgi:hypothetical protein
LSRQGKKEIVMSIIETINKEIASAAESAAKPARRLPAVPGLLLLCAIVAGAAQAQTIPSALLPSPMKHVTTVPMNGDTNPYGVAFVPQNFVSTGLLAAGDLLVSNFNNKAGLQGTGTSIVEITPAGKQTPFYQGPAGLGLSTALNVLSSGYVMVGNLPTTDGTCATVGSGSLIFLNSRGQKVLNYTNSSLIDRPWDATVYDQGSTFTVFVSNAATGEISRLTFTASAMGIKFKSGVVIASGYQHSCGSNFIVAQTGLVYDAANDILYVASTGDNAVYGVLGALTLSDDHGRGAVVYVSDKHLHGPNGLALAPNGDLIAGNSDFVNADPAQPSEYVEFTTAGQFVKQLSIDPNEGGSFGLALAVYGNTVRFAAVDDNQNDINIWDLPLNLDN